MLIGADPGIAWQAGQAAGQACLLDALPGPAWLVDGASVTLRRANQAAARWLADEPAALVGRPADQLLPTLEDAAFWDDVRRGHHAPLESQTELFDAQGGATPFLRRIVPLRAVDGLPPDTWLVTLHDCSGERAAEAEREALLAELKSTLEATAEGILVTRPDGSIRAFNRRFAELWSLPEAVVAERDDRRVYDWLRLNVTQPEPWQRRLDEVQSQLLVTSSFGVELADGARLECRTQPQWSRGRPIGRVFTFRETERLRPGAPRPAAGHGVDDWSRLPNRAAFAARLEAAVAQARASDGSLALLCVEFDRDVLFGDGGEHAGPLRTLAELAETLRQSIRRPQLLGRLGSARFGVLIEHAGDAAAEGLGRRLLDLARDTRGQGLAGLAPTIGIASYPQAGLSADELLVHAEQALVQARWQGESLRVHRYLGSSDSQRQRRLEAALRDGLSDPQFRIQYQPRIDPHTGRVQAVEALVRWHDVGHGDVHPAQFLPLVEKCGLSGVLDDWVLEHAVRQAVEWRAAGLDLVLTVNVGKAQLAQPGFVRRVEAVLQHLGWPAERLELDLTEATLRAEPEAALVALRALSALGVRLVLDDFGTGEASLMLLRRFPLSAVKLDRRLMHGVPRQPEDSAMAGGLMQLARALNLEVLVVGVESEAQRDFVAGHGCHGWQGFLYAPALEPQRLLQRCAAAPA